MTNYTTPGIYIKNEVLPTPAHALRTGVPLFIGLVSARALDDAPAGSFDTIPLPEGDGALAVVRSKRVIDQQRAKPQAVQEERRRSLADYFLATLPAPANAAVVDATDERWIVHVSHTERFHLWSEFAAAYGPLFAYGYLSEAIRGFFGNDGRYCRLQMVSYGRRATPLAALQAGLRAVEEADDIDLICVPDLMWLKEQAIITTEEVVALQNVILDHCERLGNRFAILDALPTTEIQALQEQQQQIHQPEPPLSSWKNGAIYYPFVGIRPFQSEQRGTALSTDLIYVPPCGHIAGVYARTDERIGVHKAPANEVLEGVVKLAVELDDSQQGALNAQNINCLRAFPTRGIRIWGARTVSDQPEWRYVNVRRIFITAARWIVRNLTDESFEPHTPALWARIRREVTSYLDSLFQKGALRGNSAEEAYYVKCDDENNPEPVRAVGMVITEIGLAAAAPAEFMVVRLIVDVTGVTVVEAEN